MNLDSLKQQIELLRLRQHASRIALRLFEAAKNQAEIDEVNTWFEQCNRAHDKAMVVSATEELKTLARRKNIPTEP